MICKDKTNTKVYVYHNGTELGNTASFGSTGYDSTRFGIGGNGGSAFSGIIDDVGVFNRVLTPTEVAMIYTGVGLKKISGVAK